MGVELDIVQELASINVALTELSSLTRIINGEIKSGEFSSQFNKIVRDIAKCFAVVTDNLQPFFDIDTETALIARFDEQHARYAALYLKEISKPRIYSDEAYEGYVLLRLQKEIKTGFPLLKRTFERLDKFIDKWITNDAWLAMAIDNAFKRLQTFLIEITNLKNKDSEEAFLIYASAFKDFKPYFDLIKQQVIQLEIRSKVADTPQLKSMQYSIK